MTQEDNHLSRSKRSNDKKTAPGKAALTLADELVARGRGGGE